MKRRHVLLGAAGLLASTGAALCVQRFDDSATVSAAGQGTPGAPASPAAGASSPPVPDAADPRASVAAVALRVVTFNIRGSTWEADHLDLWNRGRNQRAIAFLTSSKIDVVGFQEFEAEQEADLFGGDGQSGALGELFGRIEAPVPGARNPIAFRRDRFTVVDSGSKVLPVGWPTTTAFDDMYLRTLTWAYLRDNSTQQVFAVFNTHLEFRGSAQAFTGETYAVIRRKQAETVARLVKALNPENLPMALLGDFNSDEFGGAYGAIVTSGNLIDAQYAASHVLNSGIATYNAFAAPQVGKRIDFVFVNPQTQVRQYWINTQEFDGRLPSDHFPTLVDLTLG